MLGSLIENLCPNTSSSQVLITNKIMQQTNNVPRSSHYLVFRHAPALYSFPGFPSVLCDQNLDSGKVWQQGYSEQLHHQSVMTAIDFYLDF